MRILGKHITGAFHVPDRSEDILLGVQVTNGVCECCNSPVTVARFGLGLVEFDLFVQSGH